MKISLILFFLAFNIFLFGVTNEEKAAAGVYQYRVTEETEFLTNKEYEGYICIVLFEDGRYVKYEKNVNSSNKLDIKFTPIQNGVFNLSKNLLFLQPTQGLFEIYYYKNKNLIGAFSEFIFVKEKD